MKQGIVGWIIGGVVVVAIIAGAIFYALQNSNNVENTQPTNTPTNDTPSEPTNEARQTVTITYTDNGFSPSSYSIKAGGTVTVDNKSSRDLEFSSDAHPVHTAEPELNMSVLHAGESGTFTVTRTGTWGFHNHLNAQDTGTLRVL